MAYTNVNIRDRNSELKTRAMLEAELSFWRQRADELQRTLENIPSAVRQYGYVDLIDGDDTLTLIAKPEESSHV
jgi:hypothetical protein